MGGPARPRKSQLSTSGYQSSGHADLELGALAHPISLYGVNGQIRPRYAISPPTLRHSVRLATDLSIGVSPRRAHSAGFAGQLSTSGYQSSDHADLELGALAHPISLYGVNGQIRPRYAISPPTLRHSVRLATDLSVGVSPRRAHSAGFAGQVGTSGAASHIGQARLNGIHRLGRLGSIWREAPQQSPRPEPSY
ncbi:hypothetical protein Taro_019021, partial [Colocasia esculenta]|nr:hypothetical protein [Colocasia esculenta]